VNLLLGLLIVLGASALNAFGLNLTKLDHVRIPRLNPCYTPLGLPVMEEPLETDPLARSISPDRYDETKRKQMKNARLPKSQRRPDYLRPVWIVGMLAYM
jgi:hypothetical protein